MKGRVLSTIRNSDRIYEYLDENKKREAADRTMHFACFHMVVGLLESDTTLIGRDRDVLVGRYP